MANSRTTDLPSTSTLQDLLNTPTLSSVWDTPEYAKSLTNAPQPRKAVKRRRTTKKDDPIAVKKALFEEQPVDMVEHLGRDW